MYIVRNENKYKSLFGKIYFVKNTRWSTKCIFNKSQ